MKVCVIVKCLKKYARFCTMTFEYHRASIRHLVYTNVMYMYFAYARWRSGKNKYVDGYTYLCKVYIHRLKKFKKSSLLLF